MRIGIAQERRREKVDRHFALQCLIAGFAHLAHVAFAYRRKNFIRPEFVANGNAGEARLAWGGFEPPLWGFRLFTANVFCAWNQADCIMHGDDSRRFEIVYPAI
jgi:hypothetical protein